MLTSHLLDQKGPHKYCKGRHPPRPPASGSALQHASSSSILTATALLTGPAARYWRLWQVDHPQSMYLRIHLPIFPRLCLEPCADGHKQMRVINSIPWSSTEIESYRQIIWTNLIDGMTRVREVMDELNLETSEDNMVRPARRAGRSPRWNAPFLLKSNSPDPQALFDQVACPFDLGGQQPYPPQYQNILQTLWEDSAVQKVRALPFGPSSSPLNSPTTGYLKGQETRSPRQVRPPYRGTDPVRPNLHTLSLP